MMVAFRSAAWGRVTPGPPVGCGPPGGSGTGTRGSAAPRRWPTPPAGARTPPGAQGDQRWEVGPTGSSALCHAVYRPPAVRPSSDSAIWKVGLSLGHRKGSARGVHGAGWGTKVKGGSGNLPKSVGGRSGSTRPLPSAAFVFTQTPDPTPGPPLPGRGNLTSLKYPTAHLFKKTK